MEWLRKLRGAIVGLDTAPLIYFVEESPLYLPLVDKFFEAMADGDFQVVTSTVTLCEVLVHPYREGDQILAAEYFKILLHAKNLQVIPVTARIAAEAARLRAVHGMKAPDAIQPHSPQARPHFSPTTRALRISPA